eukprot:88082-Pyramimonas_sp.AAC.1
MHVTRAIAGEPRRPPKNRIIKGELPTSGHGLPEPRPNSAPNRRQHDGPNTSRGSRFPEEENQKHPEVQGLRIGLPFQKDVYERYLI